jgi:hypothetical protein
MKELCGMFITKKEKKKSNFKIYQNCLYYLVAVDDYLLGLNDMGIIGMKVPQKL